MTNDVMGPLREWIIRFLIIISLLQQSHFNRFFKEDFSSLNFSTIVIFDRSKFSSRTFAKISHRIAGHAQNKFSLKPRYWAQCSPAEEDVFFLPKLIFCNNVIKIAYLS